MAATPIYGFPYPGTGDSPHGPNQVQALATALEAKIAAMDAAMASILPATAGNVVPGSGTTTSATYTATLTGTGGVSATFVAPPSGKVLVHNGCEMSNSGVGYSICNFEIRVGASIGTGTVFFALDDNEGVVNSRPVARLITGLTGGTTYNIRQLFRVQSGTGTFLRKSLFVIPQFA